MSDVAASADIITNLVAPVGDGAAQDAEAAETPPAVKVSSPLNILAAKVQDADKGKQDLQGMKSTFEQERALFNEEKQSFLAQKASWEQSQSQHRSKFLADPMAGLESMGFDVDDIALITEAGYYRVMPENAPPEFQLSLQKRQLEKERMTWQEEQAEKERQAQEAQASAQGQQIVNQFMTQVNVDLGENPTEYAAMRAWYADDVATFQSDLIAVARSLATEAEKSKTQADLSPKAVMKTLDDYLSTKFKRWTPQTGKAPQQPHTLTNAPHTRGTQADAQSEEDQVRRAQELLFKAGVGQR